MSARKRGKVGIEGSRPDLPPFLQRMREQIVEAEDAQRKADSERRRKTRADNPDDGFTIVKLAEEDLTEEEYHKMKLDLEMRMKPDDTKKNKVVDLDIDSLIQTRLPQKEPSSSSQPSRTPSTTQKHDSNKPRKPPVKSATQAKSKKLSYDTSEDEED